MEFFRIHVTYAGKTGKPVGLFGACHHLKRAGKLTSDEAKLFEEIDEWYTRRLPEPPFYSAGNPRKAITWFKDTPKVRALTEGLSPLISLLEKHDVAYEISRTANPGEVIYEDEFQVATV